MTMCMITFTKSSWATTFQSIQGRALSTDKTWTTSRTCNESQNSGPPRSGTSMSAAFAKNSLNRKTTSSTTLRQSILIRSWIHIGATNWAAKTSPTRPSSSVSWSHRSQSLSATTATVSRAKMSVSLTSATSSNVQTYRSPAVANPKDSASLITKYLRSASTRDELRGPGPSSRRRRVMSTEDLRQSTPWSSWEPWRHGVPRCFSTVLTGTAKN